MPVVWAVAKGSAVNKAILVPAALAISAFAPWAVTPLLMIGGAYLCYEGFEKVAHRLWHRDEADAERRALREGLLDPTADLAALEKQKVRGAIRTDFILSAEIIVISLGIVANAPFATRVAAMVGVAALMTVGVYGIVAAIVKLDDAGVWLCRREGSGAWPRFQCMLGNALLAFAPRLMKFLAFAGTAAMFLVGGGILLHGVPPLAHAVEPYGTPAEAGAGLVAGVVAGAVLYVVVALVGRLRRK